MKFAKRVVVIGGGFAGVTLAQRLERLTGHETEIVLALSKFAGCHCLGSGSCSHGASGRTKRWRGLSLPEELSQAIAC